MPANNSLLFDNKGFRRSLRGFKKNRSKSFKSTFNETTYSTLYIPALKAFILRHTDGFALYDEENVGLAEPEPKTRVAAIGKVSDDIFVAEYIVNCDTGKQHICCFDTKKKEFLFAGETSNGGKTFSVYQLDYEDGHNGTVLWLALMPYLYTSNAEIQDLFDVVKKNYEVEYRELNTGSLEELSPDLQNISFQFCDAVYYTVGRKDFEYEIPVTLPPTGIFPIPPRDVLDTYKPVEVICGEFTLPAWKNGDKKAEKTKKRLSAEEIFCLYALEELSEAQKAFVPKMPSNYIVPIEVLEIAHGVWYHYQNAALDGDLKSNNILLFGPPGSGKSTAAKAIASTLGLPYSSVYMSANADEETLRGGIMPALDTETEVIYNSEEELLEAAELSPEMVYEDLTGIENPEATLADCIRAYGNARVKAAKAEGSGIRYTFDYTEFIKTIKFGGVVCIEEFTNVRDQGVSTMLHSVMDGSQYIQLPTGEKVQRHPNAVVIFAANTDEQQCGELETATLSRLTVKYYMDSPSKSDMISRVSAKTGFNDAETLRLMADVVVDTAKYIEEHGYNGCCGMREFIAWVLQYMSGKAFDESYTIRQAAERTIIPSASPHREDMAEMRRDIGALIGGI